MATKSAIARRPAEGDYYENGRRLVLVLSVGKEDAQVEDARELSYESIALAELAGEWKRVDRDG